MLSVNNVSYKTKEKTIISQCHCQFKAGQLTALLGPNGAGKSTLLKLASGELTASKGCVMFHERLLVDWDIQTKARSMGVLAQSSHLSFAFTVEEVIKLGRTPHATGDEADAIIVQQAMTIVDVYDLRHRYYPQLSGGEKQRVQIARILAQTWQEDETSSQTLIFDEPTSALDLAHQQQIMRHLKSRCQRGDTIIVALHDLNLAAQFADHVVLMKSGKIYAKGHPADVLETNRLEEVFGLPFHSVKHPKTGQQVLLN